MTPRLSLSLIYFDEPTTPSLDMLTIKSLIVFGLPLIVAANPLVSLRASIWVWGDD